MINEKKNIFYGTIITYINFFVSILIGVFYTSYLLRTLGEINVSIRTSSESIVSYLSLVSLGMGSAYFRFRKIRANDGGEEAEAKLNGLFVICFSIFGVIALILGIFIMISVCNGVFVVKDPTKAYLLIPISGIMILNTALNFPFSIFKYMPVYRRKHVMHNSIVLFDTILTPCVAILILLMFEGKADIDTLTIAITWSMLGCTLFIKLLYVLLAVFVLKEKINFKIGKQEFGLLKPIFIFCIFNFIVTAISNIHTSTDKIILSSTVNTSEALYYSYGMLFRTYTISLIGAITASFTPKIASDAVDGYDDKIKRTVNFVFKFIAIFLVLIFGGYAVCGKEFVHQWLNPLNAEIRSDIYYYAVILIGLYMLTAPVSFVYCVLAAKNKHKFAAIFYPCTFLINVAISWPLSYVLGIWGVIIGTVFVSLLECAVMSFYVKKSVNLSTMPYFRDLLLQLVIGGVVFGLEVLLFSSIINLSGLSYYLQALIKGVIFFFLYSVATLFVNKNFVKVFFSMLKS